MNTFLERTKKPSVFSRYQGLFVFILFICLSAYALGANPFSGETAAPFDLLLSYPGWSKGQPIQNPLFSERSDILDVQLPTWITLKSQIRAGDSALWYPYGAGGIPMSLEIYNPAFILFVAVKDNALAYYLVGLAKLVIAGFGCYLLLRVFLGWLPSLWGGVVFMLCGFNAAWFFMEHVSTAMWIPWLLWATVMHLKTEEAKWLPVVTLASLLMIAGGFLSVAAFGFYSFGLLILTWNIYAFFTGYKRALPGDNKILSVYLRKLTLPVLAVAIAFLLAAVALIPFIETVSGANLDYRAGTTFRDGTIFGAGTNFKNGLKDLLLFFFYENPSRVERTAYIGLPVFIFALLGVFAAFRGKDKDLKPFIGFASLLVVLTISIAFGLLPHDLIKALPVFNNHSWGRLVVVSHLGLAILSAFGLNYFASTISPLFVEYLHLAPLNAGRVVILIVIAVTALQFHTQKKLFNNFNAIVPSSWFYPVTPSIKYVKERLAPLQSVIADGSFLVSGTLGAYGIAEWYAHAFRTDKEKEILSSLVHDPFRTATAAIIRADGIRLGSPLMEKLVIKYVLAYKDMIGREMLQVPSNKSLSLTPAPPLPENILRQRLHLPNDMIIGAFGFLVATNGLGQAPADLRLSIYNDRGEKFVFEHQLDKKDISDNEWCYFVFPDKLYLKKGGYSLVLSLPDHAGHNKLTLLAAENLADTGDRLEINGVPTDMSFKMRIIHYDQANTAVTAKKWNVINLEKNIATLENMEVTNSAYFLSRLDPSEEVMDFSGLEVRQISAGLIEINYSGVKAGWVVLPMHLHEGWKAYVDNQEVRYDTYIDILPAIPVKGASLLKFKYQPESFRRGLTISLVGLFIFIVFSGICLRNLERPRWFVRLNSGSSEKTG